MSDRPADRLVILDGLRTPFCKAGTEFNDLSADDIGASAVKSLLARTGVDPARIDETIFGCVGNPADATNVSRVIALRAGVPEHVPAITVCRNCASGAEAITQAYEKMAAGRGEVFLVGGVESMSNYPMMYEKRTAEKFAKVMKAKSLADRAREFLAFRPQDFTPLVGLKLGLMDKVSGLNMGETAELVGREQRIPREAQDQFAYRSHQRAAAARERLAEEIAPVIRDGAAIDTDNGVRPDVALGKLANLSPMFERPTGTVTAGNASQVTDGAVALLVASERAAKDLGLTPLGTLAGYAYAGCDPARMGLGPAHAVHRAEQRCGFGLADADLVEINEAFAAQVLACLKVMADPGYCRERFGRDAPLGEIPDERLNVNGGAISLGHPVGATGARLVLTALKELARRGKHRALVSACVGGGQGMALWLER